MWYCYKYCNLLRDIFLGINGQILKTWKKLAQKMHTLWQINLDRCTFESDIYQKSSCPLQENRTCPNLFEICLLPSAPSNEVKTVGKIYLRERERQSDQIGTYDTLYVGDGCNDIILIHYLILQQFQQLVDREIHPMPMKRASHQAKVWDKPLPPPQKWREDTWMAQKKVCADRWLQFLDKIKLL